jgi:hypothetical protein
MHRRFLSAIAFSSLALVVASGAPCLAKPVSSLPTGCASLQPCGVEVNVGTLSSQSQDPKNPYPTMAPLDQYLISDRNAEIAMARSAAPESISKDADVMVLGRHGYETAVKGKNGFVCLVWRGWAGTSDDADFWNPNSRGPVCLNPAAARFNVPLTQKRTELILAGRSQSQMFADINTAFDKKEFPALEPGAMCYMLSKLGHLNNAGGPWHPHLMFFVPLTESATWGAGSAGSPVVMAFEDTPERHTVFIIPVAKWSDGTADAPGGH